MSWPFSPLTPLAYDVILIDPPWAYEMYGAGGYEKSPQKHYDCMDQAALKALPVGHLASRNCVLVIWATFAFLPRALELIAAWQFEFKTGGVWHKKTVNGKTAFGTGYVLRSAAEPFLIATVGAPKTSRGERNLIEAQVREHSRKPDEMHEMIERLIPNAHRRAELFARASRPGWEIWGNETEKFDAP